MNIRRFSANFIEAQSYASDVMRSKNDLARVISSDKLNATVDNMIEELNTIIKGEVDKDKLLNSLLEDAETYSRGKR